MKLNPRANEIKDIAISTWDRRVGRVTAKLKGKKKKKAEKEPQQSPSIGNERARPGLEDDMLMLEAELREDIVTGHWNMNLRRPPSSPAMEGSIVLKNMTPVRRSPRFTAPEYHSFFHAQPLHDPAPAIVISLDDDTEGEPSSDGSTGFYSISTSSSDAALGSNFDSTNHSSGSLSTMTSGSDSRSP
ncbi:hypothetical protein PIB30_075784 [Stylosanthes scabra]|uniref:Uncharacterized protein n=1 Tax=Stylosanthes scabra TaxID=79078 RepID=A0ABU6ZNS5_9FABA|nr:hypothetical protein [Stylosanthes scabra]